MRCGVSVEFFDRSFQVAGGMSGGAYRGHCSVPGGDGDDRLGSPRLPERALPKRMNRSRCRFEAWTRVGLRQGFSICVPRTPRGPRGAFKGSVGNPRKTGLESRRILTKQKYRPYQCCRYRRTESKTSLVFARGVREQIFRANSLQFQ